MAYSGFSTSKLIELSNGLVTAAPLTMACFARAPTLNIGQSLIAAVNSGSANGDNIFQLRVPTTNVIYAYTSTSSTNANAASTATITANTWFHACAVFTNANLRAAYLNGGNKGTDTLGKTPSGINSINIGATDQATNSAGWSGDIAEVGIWNAALDDAEVASLAAGFSPLLVRPQSLVAYLPLARDLIDFRGNAFALVGAPVVSNDHPLIYNPY